MNYYLKAYILYTLLYSTNLLQIPLVPCVQSPRSNFFRNIDSMKKFDNGKIPCIKLYFGIPAKDEKEADAKLVAYKDGLMKLL